VFWVIYWKHLDKEQKQFLGPLNELVWVKVRIIACMRKANGCSHTLQSAYLSHGVQRRISLCGCDPPRLLTIDPCWEYHICSAIQAPGCTNCGFWRRDALKRRSSPPNMNGLYMDQSTGKVRSSPLRLKFPYSVSVRLQIHRHVTNIHGHSGITRW
jgi:hypothetical protein